MGREAGGEVEASDEAGRRPAIETNPAMNPRGAAQRLTEQARLNTGLKVLFTGVHVPRRQSPPP
jgi:hypothetical protein